MANKNADNAPLTRIATGGRLARPYRLFTYIATVAGGVAVFFAVPETDQYGNDHVFSGMKRYIDKKRDEFFDIKPADYMDASSSE